MDQHVLRDRKSLWSIIFDPAEKDESKRGGYGYVRAKISVACHDLTISRQAQDELLGYVEKIRQDYLAAQNAEKLGQDSE